jgi:DNA repair photolyase
MAELARAGVPAGLAVAPVIPGLNDSHIPELLKRARDAGARTAFINLLRLPSSVAPYFEQRLREQLPTKADRVVARISEVRGGQLNNSEFGKRMAGEGEYWRMIEQVFRPRTAAASASTSSRTAGRASRALQPSAAPRAAVALRLNTRFKV